MSNDDARQEGKQVSTRGRLHVGVEVEFSAKVEISARDMPFRENRTDKHPPEAAHDTTAPNLANQGLKRFTQNTLILLLLLKQSASAAPRTLASSGRWVTLQIFC